MYRTAYWAGNQPKKMREENIFVIEIEAAYPIRLCDEYNYTKLPKSKSSWFSSVS